MMVANLKDDFISDILADETRDGGQIYNLPKDRISLMITICIFLIVQ